MLNEHVLTYTTMREIQRLGQLGDRIADRWAGGWPARTVELEQSGKLLRALQKQVKRELPHLIERNRTHRHLADHEYLEMMGVPLSPP